MKPNIEITENHTKDVALLLNTLLADEYVLYTKTRNAHWNIQGQNFIELHKFFESQYDALDIIIDDVAERVGSRLVLFPGSDRQAQPTGHQRAGYGQGQAIARSTFERSREHESEGGGR